MHRWGIDIKLRLSILFKNYEFFVELFGMTVSNSNVRKWVQIFARIIVGKYANFNPVRVLVHHSFINFFRTIGHCITFCISAPMSGPFAYLRTRQLSRLSVIFIFEYIMHDFVERKREPITTRSWNSPTNLFYEIENCRMIRDLKFS